MASTEHFDTQLDQLAIMTCQFGNDVATLLGDDHPAVSHLADAVAAIIVARAKIISTRKLTPNEGVTS
jgi:hypothetical protein